MDFGHISALDMQTETAVKQFDVELEGLKELRDPAIVSLRGVCMELRVRLRMFVNPSRRPWLVRQ